ncbi:MAG: hypothetical protein R2711_03500 [Acidimicrobiales bacterium]
MGVPLLVETIPGSDPPLLGYRIRPADYELRDPGLEPDELEALNLAAAVTGFAGGMGQRALFKLGAGAADQPRAELPTDPSLVAAFRGGRAPAAAVHLPRRGARCTRTASSPGAAAGT